MIVDKEMNYFFLEINPIGQFGVFNSDCLINVEKHIAEKLISYAKN